MKEIKFNWIVPREYKDPKTNEIKYAICRGNERMNIDTLDKIHEYANDQNPKNAQPWGQAFVNGYRVMSENLDYSEWNGTTFADVDSKWYYNLCKPFDANKLLKEIVEWAPLAFEKNYYACHLTNSKQGYRIFWYWDCEKTEENFRKCCILTEQYTRELFYSFGENGKEIIDFESNGHRVLDRCSNSIMQGFYVTSNEIYYSHHINENGYGTVDLSDITVEQAYQSSNLVKTIGDFDQKEWCNIKYVNDVSKDSIKYYPHQHRRCIFEALCMLYDGKELDEQWERICKLLPEGNGHDCQFYIDEPNRCKWYEKINNDIVHDLHWLDEFGYVYDDKTEYVYFDQFRKSWKWHIRKKLMNAFIDKKIKEYDNENGKGQFDKLDEDSKNEHIDEWKGLVDASNIFDKKWDNEMKDESILDECRSNYWKTRWEAKDFCYLCLGYDIPKDIVTYKMYADFYYRDKNNLPLVKYDSLEDEIFTYGYWPETYKHQWHTFKYGNEYTHWKNNDTFSNKCVKTDLLEAINKFVPRWFSFHSIKDYLNSLDLSTANEELLETWAIRYFKANDTKLTRMISRNFFVAAVKKQLIEDPIKFVFQHMLFLQGKTGSGKTSFLVTMFTIDGKSYILNKIDPNGKDNEIGPLIAKNWLIQFGESENLKKVSVNAAKEFLDRINLGMKYQKKYENEQTTIYPRIMACRTSNDDILFNDISVNVDRRNWLIECNVPENYWNDELQAQLEKEKDILWATALKIYLDNPNASLELTNDLFLELGMLQEKHKLITSDDIKEIYDGIFERYYRTNAKGHIKDEASFLEQSKHSDADLKDNLVNSLLDTSLIENAQEHGLMPQGYEYKKKLEVIPVRWLKDYICSSDGTSTWKLLKDYILRLGWIEKQVWYDGNKKCLCKKI